MQFSGDSGGPDDFKVATHTGAASGFPVIADDHVSFRGNRGGYRGKRGQRGDRGGDFGEKR